uniref:Galectin n=1 Tax=Eptatretus burgeri TaxID=7764 RepID=A0A8C4Q583_EPTBU
MDCVHHASEPKVTNHIELKFIEAKKKSSWICDLDDWIIDQKIVLKLFPNRGHTGFQILLKEIDSDDIAFQFNVEFKKNIFVTHSLVSGERKNELETDMKFPHTEFTLKFVCEHDAIVILHEEKEIGRFKHDIPPYKINCIEIKGGVEIVDASLQTK